MYELGLVWWSMWYIFYLETINTEEEIEDFLWENLIISSNSRKFSFCSIVVKFEFNNSGIFNYQKINYDLTLYDIVLIMKWT